MNWDNVKLKDVSEYRIDKIESQFIDTENYISTDNMLPNKQGIELSVYPPTSKKVSHYKKNDVLVSNIRPYFKKIWYANKEGGCSNDVIIFKTTSQKIYSKFLYYQLSQNRFFDFMMAGANGTKMPRGNKKAIPNFEFLLPPLQTQKRIASILSAYDDLIKNNLKHIKLLEQAAQNIYKEWFVNMRFPGHENTPIDEETGLPEGWEEKGICEFNSFKQYKSKIQPFEGEKEYLATANVNRISIEERGDSFTYENKPSRAQIHPPLNSVWFARMSKTDKVLFITEKTNNDFMISSGFVGFKVEKKEFLPFLFCLINNSKFSKLKDANATGSTQVSINNKSLNSIKLIEPTYEMIEKFGALNYDSLELIQHLFKANEKLKSARDILLPRLMNQTIEV